MAGNVISRNNTLLNLNKSVTEKNKTVMLRLPMSHQALKTRNMNHLQAGKANELPRTLLPGQRGTSISLINYLSEENNR